MSRKRVTATSPELPQPSPDLKSLNPLVGTWRISGGTKGQIRFEWMDGGFFLIQHVDLEYGGRKITGIEMIGRRHRPGEPPGPDICSRFYSFLDGLTLDYVYEFANDTLTIWYGPRGSDNCFIGKFSKDGHSFRGAWKWPSGGYEVTGTRVP